MRKKIYYLALKKARSLYDSSNKMSHRVEKSHENKRIGQGGEIFVQIFIFSTTIVLLFPLLLLIGFLKKPAQ